MQLATRHNNITSQGNIGEETGFSIAVNAKMFRVLSDTMYQDKIGSIVREISCNAVDAMNMAGTPDVPFTIHVPNAIEPWLSIQDEGVGLSDEEIRSTYTTYGESTKDNDNGAIGAFGLGAKTPFAYTDQFTITSINAGVKRTYVAMIGNDGLPTLNMKDQRPCDDHAGLTVTIGINDEDFYEVKQAITKQLQFLPVKPNLINNLGGLEFADLTEGVKFSNDLVTMYTGKYENSLKGIWIIQGGVGYPLDRTKLVGMSIDTANLAKALNNVNSYMIFPIGEISVTTNRESLSYEKATIQNIIKRLEEVSKTVAADIIESLQATNSLWERACIFKDQIDIFKVATAAHPLFSSLFPESRIKLQQDSRGKINGMYMSRHPIEKMGMYIVHGITKKFMRGYNRTEKLTRGLVGGTYGNIEPKRNTVVMVRDIKKRPVATINHYWELNGKPDIYIIERGSCEFTTKEIKRIANHFSIPAKSILRLSDMPSPVSSKTGSQGGTYDKPTAYEFGVGDSEVCSRHWKRLVDPIDDIEDAIYIEMDRHDLVDRSARSVEYIMKAKNIGLITLPIIAVNGKTYQRIADGKIGAHLTSVESIVEPLKEQHSDEREIYKRIRAIGGMVSEIQSNKIYSTFCNVRSRDDSLYGFNHPVFAKVSKLLSIQNILRARIPDSVYMFIEATTNAYPFIEKGGLMGHKIATNMVGHYPMIDFIRCAAETRNEESREIIKDYIAVVDSKLRLDRCI